MTKNTPLVLVLALGLGLAAGPAIADEAEKKEEQKAMSFGLDALKERFAAAAPDVGQQVPDISVYSASGEKVSFRDLVEGHYSVVVFGCLT
ncbi:MAG: hypothetical protein O7A07_05300 [Acidobacteria bacterium]|nr:hypothetical protein [Acidobacteriota bacterium]